MAKVASLTDALFAKLQSQILSGDLSPGERLPTQKQIAVDEDVSRTVVREAVARLEAQGLAEARQGSGVFVAAGAHYHAFQVTREELAELADVVKLLETRLAIEAEMAAFAASRRTMDDVNAIRAALRAIDAANEDPGAAAQADMRFHLAIAKATHNDYFVRLIDFLGMRLVPPRTLFLRDESPEAHQGYIDRVREEHEAIVEAIVRMDATRARDAARHHMEESLSRHMDLNESAQVAKP
ncbi:FadR/GntR family transcriptional regulator [Sphingomonas sp. RS2018]